ncbi:MAG: cysteine desulfurase family protein [Cellulosilyticaceae bacterium]
MIYLDYAANTPVDEEVLRTFCDISAAYLANPNSSHQLGQDAKARLDLSTAKISKLLDINASEIIYTSGASESNNLAIKGIASKYKKYGKHIITTYLEHSSVTSPIAVLQAQGYDIDFVDILANGLVDLEHLKELLREDTILVSISYVDSELGIVQPIEEIGTLLSVHPHCHFHVDATQAVGKISTTLSTIDLVTFAPHKFYGLNGCGILIKKDKVLLDPLIHGGVSTTAFRSGSPTLALIVSIDKALELALAHRDSRYKHVSHLNKLLREHLSSYSSVKINSTSKSMPFILNLSLKGMNAVALQSELEKHEIYVATKSACCTLNTPSRPVYALTKDRKLALSTLRISLSHLTTEDDITKFLECFDACYKKLIK